MLLKNILHIKKRENVLVDIINVLQFMNNLTYMYPFFLYDVFIKK